MSFFLHSRQARKQVEKKNNAEISEMVTKPVRNEFLSKDYVKSFKELDLTLSGSVSSSTAINTLLGKQILLSVGCYQAERLGPQIIKSIKGDFFNVLGFPLFPFLNFLSKSQE